MTHIEHLLGQKRGAWGLNGVVLAILLVGMAIRLFSPAILLDIGALWPIGVVLLAVGWVAQRIWPSSRLAYAPVMPLLIFTWLVLSVSLHFTDISALPSRSADLRGPPVEQTDFTMLAVQMSEGRLVVSGESGPSAYQVKMARRGGGAGIPLAVEGRGEITIIDVRDPLPFDLESDLRDNAWLRFAGWKVGLHPEPTWNLTLSAPEVAVDLRGMEIAGLAVTGEGSLKVGEVTGPVEIAVNGAFTIEVPAETSVEVIGAAVVPEDWTVEEEIAWFGERGAGWKISVTEDGLAQITTATE